MAEHSPLEAFWDYVSVASKLHNLRTQALPKHKPHTAREMLDRQDERLTEILKIQHAILQAFGELYKHLDNSKCTTR